MYSEIRTAKVGVKETTPNTKIVLKDFYQSE
jgi:hypothetical protein